MIRKMWTWTRGKWDESHCLLNGLGRHFGRGNRLGAECYRTLVLLYGPVGKAWRIRFSSASTGKKHTSVRQLRFDKSNAWAERSLIPVQMSVLVKTIRRLDKEPLGSVCWSVLFAQLTHGPQPSNMTDPTRASPAVKVSIYLLPCHRLVISIL